VFYFAPYLIALMDWPRDLMPLVVAATSGGAVDGGIAGLITGLSQRLILLRLVPWASSWVLATITGWIIGGIMFWVFQWLDYWLFDNFNGYFINGERGEQPSPIFHVVFVALASGGVPVATGICQWFVLRRYLRGSNWWPLLTVLGWGLVP